jgi:hypothetical protein
MLPVTPLTILIGSPEQTEKNAIDRIQKTHCNENEYCLECSLIRNKKSPRTYWFQPSKNYYTLDDLEYLSTITQYQAAVPTFIIITHAELLSEQVANSLLKIIEEPPFNYYFLFLTDRPERLLPTITSRSTKVYTQEKNDIEAAHHIFQFFSPHANHQPQDFLKYLEKETPSEIATIQLLEELVIYWLEKTTRKQEILTWYQKQLAYIPMPGGAKIFWKNLYVDFFMTIKPLLQP